MKTTTLPEFLTDAQIKACIGLYPDRKRIRDEIVAPNMMTINVKLGQENDPDYLSFAIIYAIEASAAQSRLS